MNATSFIVTIIILVGITVFIYTSFGFEITIIFLIIDFSVGVSYSFDKLQKLIKEESQ
jgi:hypothetical protein